MPFSTSKLPRISAGPYNLLWTASESLIITLQEHIATTPSSDLHCTSITVSGQEL